jgi:adenylate cyclase
MADADVFISYARSTAAPAHAIAEALRAAGYAVWRDDELPAHRVYAEVIEERLRAAKAVVVVWSAEAVKSQWVRAEAEVAREAGTLVQLRLDAAMPPLPFNQIQCADLAGWAGDIDAAGWRKVMASIAELTAVAAKAPRPQPVAAAPAPPVSSKPSIAVLPFANLSRDPEQDYFVDGMTEEIVAALTRFRSLFVISSGSTLAFKGETVSARDAGRQLGVRYVLEGSVRKSGEQVRIAVKLTDASDGAQIWAQRFDDTLDDIFALQDRVALSTAGAIEPTVREAELRRAADRPTDDLSSYDLYLRAMALWRVYRRGEVLRALELLERAIAIDPDFAGALAHAALCHSVIAQNGWTETPDADRQRGIALAERAVNADGDDAEVLATVAGALPRLNAQPELARTLSQRAVALNPGSVLAWFNSASVHLWLGEPGVAIEHAERASRLDPLSSLGAVVPSLMALARFQQGRLEEALAEYDRTAFRTPSSHAVLAAIYGHLGRLDEARASLARHQALDGASIEAFANTYFRHAGPRRRFLDGIALAAE